MTLKPRQSLEALKRLGFHVHEHDRPLPAGSDVVVSGQTNGKGEKFLAFHGKNGAVQHSLPLAPKDLDELEKNARAYHHLPSEKIQSMLRHLLEHAAGLLGNSAVETFWIEARLYDDSYTVTGASIAVSKPLHPRARLAPHAHDMKGNYVPSGKQ